MEQLITKVNEVENDVKETFSRINQGNQNDKIVTILLGPTGSGKTTIYYALTGKPLTGMKNGRKKYLSADTPNEKFEIGHQEIAKTYKPGIEYDEGTDIIFCDCPGFFDNRGEVQDITNSFGIFRVLSHAKNVKILLLACIQDVTSARGAALSDSCTIVENLIRSRPALQPSIALVITKVPPEYLPQNANEKLTLLDNVYTKDGWLLKMFKDSAKKDNRNVFCFPNPRQDMIGQPYSGFDDKILILNFIRNSPVTHIMPFISLSNSSKLLILDNIECFGSLPELLSEFVQVISVSYSESDDYLDLWKDRVDKLCSSTFSSPRDFVNKAKETIYPSTERFDGLYEKFTKIDEWKSFLKRVAVEEFGGENNAEKCISQNSDILNAVFLDISKYLCDILTPSHSILLDKIEKRNIDIKKKQTIEELRRLAELNDKILKEQQIQKELAIKREHELRVQWEQRKKEMEMRRIQNSSGGGGGGGGGCLLI